MTTTLPVLHIKTAHSRYVIDQNVGTFSRVPQHADANDLSAWGVGPEDTNKYEDIVSPLEVGERLVITLADGRWVRSTPIESIEEV